MTKLLLSVKEGGFLLYQYFKVLFWFLKYFSLILEGIWEGKNIYIYRLENA